MPGFTTIINSLLGIWPSESIRNLYRSTIKLHPSAENLSDSRQVDRAFDNIARGWLNRHAFEAGSSWQWPFWINHQTHPASPSYIDPSLSPLLFNQSCRDAVAIPGLPRKYSGTMDRRGMVTPPNANFSIEIWTTDGHGNLLIPSTLFDETQISYNTSESSVAVTFSIPDITLTIIASAREIDEFSFIRLQAHVKANHQHSCLYFAVRPYNREGILPLHDLVYNSRGFWMSDGRIIGWLPEKPAVSWASDARHDDAAFFMTHPPERTAIRCPAGMGTAISRFDVSLAVSGDFTAEIIIPLEPTITRAFPFIELSHHLKEADPAAGLRTSPNIIEVQQAQLSALTDYSHPDIRSSLVTTPSWLPSVIRAVALNNQHEQAVGLMRFAGLAIQKNGYLENANGRWTFPGQYLATLAWLSGQPGSPCITDIASYQQIRAVARWIMRKRREVSHAADKPSGLLPPGLTSTGSGPEYNLIDNLWALEGLLAAAVMARQCQEHSDADLFRKDAERYATRLSGAIHRELEYGLSQMVPARLHRAFDPATAPELLNVIFMPEIRRLINYDDWLRRIMDNLFTPLPHQGSDTRAVILRYIDSKGVYPARRILLALAMDSLSVSSSSGATVEADSLTTAAGIYTDCINLQTGMGVGQSAVSIEATALHILLKSGSITRLRNDDTAEE